MNIFKRVTVIFLMAFSLFASANIFASEKDYIFFSDVASVKEFQKVVYNMGKTDSFEITTYALNVTNKNGFNIREFILKKPTKDRLLGMCSPKSENLRAKHGVKPATVKDCADVIQAAYDANMAGRMTNTQAETVIKSAFHVYNNNNWDGKLLSETVSSFDTRHIAMNSSIFGMINARHTLSAGLQDVFLSFDESIYNYIANTGVVKGNIASIKVCEKVYAQNFTSRNCPGLDKHNNIKPNE